MTRWKITGIIATIVIIVILIIPLNLLPYSRSRQKMSFAAWLYFFVIGAGFMIIEVILIQRYTLFIGPSSQTVIAILFTLLIGSGLGSRFAGKFHDSVPFICIICWNFWNYFFNCRYNWSKYGSMG